MSFRLLLPLSLAAALLAGCAGMPIQEEPEVPIDEALTEMSPDEAWEQSVQLPDEQRTLQRLELLKLWHEQGQWEALSTWLPALEVSDIPPERRAEFRLLQAYVFQHHEDYLAALTVLPQSPQDMLTLELQMQLYEQLKDTENSTRTRLHRAAQLDPDARLTEFQRVWNQLAAVDLQQLQDWRGRSRDEEWRGWLDLALLARPETVPLISPQDTVREWRRNYPEHPGIEWLSTVLVTLQALRPDIQQIAALLPLSGKLRRIGRAIRAGLERRLRSVPGDAPELLVYDTGDSNADAVTLYQQAVADGADRIIGPFAKSAVAELARARVFDTPTLSLNYLDNLTTSMEHLHQFGLLPEDEAVQVAQRALEEGHRSALAFAPNNNWGRRLHESFKKAFEAGGGTVRGEAFYLVKASDHTMHIKDALQLSAGEQRQHRLEEVLGQEVISRPTRRQDIDMVFLASSPRNARLLKPQLDFYHAQDLPVYTTSHIYTGVPSPLEDQDLDDIRFCDAPMILRDNLRQILEHSSIAKQLPRFFALGADAALLTMNLSYLKTQPNTILTGWTGRLSVLPGRRVFRSLDWARFYQGQAIPLDS